MFLDGGWPADFTERDRQAGRPGSEVVDSGEVWSWQRRVDRAKLG
jgi:hypothetical protein